MLAAGLPHALLLVGPDGVGKTTLALDVAAALLCTNGEVAARPCRACRSCRLVGAGGHPDVHVLTPGGAGSVIGADAIRALTGDLALLPAEGGARIAVFEDAHRLTEDAQNVLLKTLEEPPAGVTLILCADEEDRLLPTIHSRCARVRLGTLGPREIEALLAERGEADAPTANRLARLAGGRPGVAVAFARAPDASGIRAEIARTLLDLTAERRAVRLTRVRELLVRSADLAAALAPPVPDAERPAPRGGRRSRAKAASVVAAGAASDEVSPAGLDGSGGDAESSGATEASPAGPTRASAAERRRAAAALLGAWRDVGRDLALVQVGDVRDVRDPDLIEELATVASTVPSSLIAAFLARLARGEQLLDGNANPELTIDVLALAWPQRGVRQQVA
jgi:DNA polymerase-3 subunit delta'